MDPESRVIAVGRRPLCIWDVEISDWNRGFVQGFNPRSFQERALTIFGGEEPDEADIPSADALHVRLIYHHALETFFALAFAAFQAGGAVPHWLTLYRNWELRDLLEALESGSEIYNSWGVPQPGWDGFTRIFHGGLEGTAGLPPESLESATKAWRALGSELTQDGFIWEYNALKHGYRATGGPVGLQIGAEGDPNPARPFHAHSDHSSLVAVPRPIPDSASITGAAHVRFTRSSLAWSVRGTMLRLDLLTHGMSNILETLKVGNGYEEKGQIHYFEDPDTYLAPWRDAPKLRHMNLDLPAPNDGVAERFPREELVKHLREASGMRPEG